MDPRVERHAAVIVDHCLDLQAGDEVLLMVPSVAEDLAVALAERAGDRGAFPIHVGGSARSHRAFIRAMDPEAFDEPPAAYVALAERADAAVSVRASTNTHQTSDVPPEKNAAFAQLMQPIEESVTGKRWVGTQYPAPGNAQDAEMSTPAYEAFVYDAVNKDWAAQRAFQANTVELLDDADEVRIVAGETTDLTMSVAGMAVVNDDARKNLPGGEVFTAPVPDTVDGEVLFDMPVMHQGRELVDVRLTFEAGEVVDAAAEKNEALLESLLETDAGARRVGELGIGMNRDIDRFTANMLFDEKMGDTVHLALGRSIDETVPEGREGNDSAIHVDMLVDMSADARIELDGEVVQRNGTFVFEDGFDDGA
jgi:aminopeptidase